MGDKGKILNFTIKDKKLNNNNKASNMGIIVNLDVERKIKEKEELNSEIQDSMSYMIWLLGEIYNDMYDVKDEDFIVASKQLHNAINELEKYSDRLNNIDIKDMDELIFKLNLMVEVSCYFVTIFNILDSGEDIDLFELKYYISLSYLYTESMESIIKETNYDYDKYEKMANQELDDLSDVVEEMEIRNKIDAYTAILTSKTEEKTGKLANDLQINILSELISDTVKNFASFDVDIMLEYYNKVLDRYIESGILNMTSLDDIDFKMKILKLYRNIERQYYYSYRIVDNFIIFADKYTSEKEAINLSNRFDKLFYIIDKMHESGNIEGMNTIERTIKLIYDKVISMVELTDESETDKKLEEIFSDEIVLNSIYMISDDLVNNKIERINKNSFEHMWTMCRSYNINKYLTDIVRREMFSNKDIDFYSNTKYRDLIELEIKGISNNAYYSGFDVEESYIKDDFDKILEMLKKSYRLENSAIYYGFNNILDDINKIDYLDYSYCVRYLDMLEYVFSGIDQIDLKVFLNNSAYLPTNIQYKNNDYISLYRNKSNSLLMNNNGYYLVSNDGINSMDSINIDNKYSDRENIYDMVIGNINYKYNCGKKMLEIKGIKRNAKR